MEDNYLNRDFIVRRNMFLIWKPDLSGRKEVEDNEV